jgi:PAS domain S-box-containing protein
MENLKKLAQYLLQEKSITFANEYLEQSRKLNTPIWEELNLYPEEEIKTLFKESSVDFLLSIVEGTLINRFEKKLQGWKNGITLPKAIYNLHFSDITLLLQAQKNTLMKFAPDVARNVEEIIYLFREIEDYYTEAQKLSLKFIEEIAKKHLEEANEQLSTALSIAKLGNWKWDLKNNKLIWSEELYKIYEISSDFELNYDNFLSFIDLEDKEILLEKINSAITEKKPFDFYHKVILKNQKVKTIHARGKVLLDNNGEVISLFGTGQDVTEKMNALYELRKKEAELTKLNAHLEEKVNERTIELKIAAEKFKILLETLPLLAWTAGSDGKINYLNQQWLKFTGFKKFSEIKFSEVIHPDDFLGTKLLWEKSNQTGEAYEYKYRCKRYDNTYRWYLARANPIKDSENNVLLWIGTATDIHEQVSANEKKDEFISIASHELKTPLTSIKAYVQLIEQTSNHQEIKTYATKASLHAEKLSALVTDLLDVSKIQAGKLDIKLSKFNLLDLINETIESLGISGFKHKIKQIGNASIQLKADRRRIEQVLQNFLSNAIKYSPDSNEVLLQINQENEQLKISVTDFGIGIPSDKVEQVFERFYRVTTKRKFKGLGLGLFISKEIINLHQGKIWVESEEGKGSTFHFTLPIKD